MRIIIYGLMIAIISLSVYGAGGEVSLTDLSNYGRADIRNECSTAKFCGNYELTCSPYSDGRCPEDFGDWGACDSNNYGSKCAPCDPDCGDCGNGLEIKVPNVQYPGGSITIEVKAYGEYTDNHRFELSKETAEDQYEPVSNVIVDCQNNVCSRNFNVNINNAEPCRIYNFRVVFKRNDGTFISSAFDKGMVSPYIDITNPGDNDILNGNVQITSNVGNCIITPGSDLLRGLYNICQGENCERLTTSDLNPNGQFNYMWDTNRNLNGNYGLNAIIVARKEGIFSGYTDTVSSITLINELGISENYQGSKILNIILARIKTWI